MLETISKFCAVTSYICCLTGETKWQAPKPRTKNSSAANGRESTISAALPPARRADAPSSPIRSSSMPAWPRVIGPGDNFKQVSSPDRAIENTPADHSNRNVPTLHLRGGGTCHSLPEEQAEPEDDGIRSTEPSKSDYNVAPETMTQRGPSLAEGQAEPQDNATRSTEPKKTNHQVMLEDLQRRIPGYDPDEVRKQTVEAMKKRAEAAQQNTENLRSFGGMTVHDGGRQRDVRVPAKGTQGWDDNGREPKGHAGGKAI